MSNVINHVLFCLDASYSMKGLRDTTVKVFDNQVKHLAELSRNLNQEIRITVYSFDDDVKNLIFDMDVFRVPSIDSLYHIGGNTVLLDATIKGVTDLKQTLTLYGEHTFLGFVLTDGEENRSKNKPADLQKLFNTLPDNWTLAILVPNQTGKFTAEKYGFPKDNIQIWDTTTDGLEKASDIVRAATTEYIKSTSTGVRSSKNMFSVDTSNLKADVIKKKLKELKSSEYSIFPVTAKVAVKPFVEGWTKDYVIGSAYYQLSKTEKIQPNKQIVVQHKMNGKVYGGSEGRNLLGLPNYEVKVNPVDHKDYIIYVQSASVNRWLVPGTNLLVMK